MLALGDDWNSPFLNQINRVSILKTANEPQGSRNEDSQEFKIVKIKYPRDEDSLNSRGIVEDQDAKEYVGTEGMQSSKEYVGTEGMQSSQEPSLETPAAMKHALKAEAETQAETQAETEIRGIKSIHRELVLRLEKVIMT